MLVDDSFNYHSLSLTIMFAIKWSMIVHDSLSKSHNVPASLNYFPDIKFQSSIISSSIPIVVVIAKKCSTNIAGPRTHLLGCISNYHSTSRCLFFQIFSLFSLSRFQRHCRPNIRPNYCFVVLHRTMAMQQPYCIEPALVTLAYRKTLVHYHPLGQTEKNYLELSCQI